MSYRFFELMFTAHVRTIQEELGSRNSYARLEGEASPGSDRLGPHEAEFVKKRESFYLATVSETGWPYVQHRGGPIGFLKILDDQTIGFADYRGNRQYVSVGNLATNDRVALFLMDYPNRRRLKLIGHARTIDAATDPGLTERLHDEGYSARVERGIVIKIAAFDWNCPQHITQRFTAADLEPALVPYKEKIKALEAQISELLEAQMKPGI